MPPPQSPLISRQHSQRQRSLCHTRLTGSILPLRLWNYFHEIGSYTADFHTFELLTHFLNEIDAFLGALIIFTNLVTYPLEIVIIQRTGL